MLVISNLANYSNCRSPGRKGPTHTPAAEKLSSRAVFLWVGPTPGCSPGTECPLCSWWLPPTTPSTGNRTHSSKLRRGQAESTFKMLQRSLEPVSGSRGDVCTESIRVHTLCYGPLPSPLCSWPRMPSSSRSVCPSQSQPAGARWLADTWVCLGTTQVRRCPHCWGDERASELSGDQHTVKLWSQLNQQNMLYNVSTHVAAPFGPTLEPSKLRCLAIGHCLGFTMYHLG